MRRFTLFLQALLLPSFIWLLLGHYYTGASYLLDANGHPSNVLFLTAHPDDECMFFAPTILVFTSLSNEEIHNDAHVTRENGQIYSLCLSSGDADGLGEVRKKELRGSLDVLGIPQERSWVLDEPFKDNITMYWDAELVAKYVRPYVLDYKIDIIMTFDEHGISSHPNHISLLHGVRVLLSDKTLAGLRAFSLETTSLIPKYIGPAAVLVSRLEQAYCTYLSPLVTNWIPESNPQTFDALVSVMKSSMARCSTRNENLIVSGIPEYARALEAMRKHESQLVWFRWLYVSFSRYMWVNTWQQVLVER